MTVLALANQRMAIIVVHGPYGGMAGNTTTRPHRRYAANPGRGYQLAGKGDGIKGMASTAGIMDRAIGHIHRNTCRSPGRGVVTVRARVNHRHCGAVASLMAHYSMTGQAIIGRCRLGVMMNAAKRKAGHRMTG